MKVLMPFIGHNDAANEALFVFCEEHQIKTNPQCIGIVTFDDFFPEFDCDTISFNDEMPPIKILNLLLDAPYEVETLTFYPINSDYQELSDFLNENKQ